MLSKRHLFWMCTLGVTFILFIDEAGAAIACKNNKTNSFAATGSTYTYYKISSGSQTQCSAAKVVSTCSATTGEFIPAITTSVSTTCTVIPTPTISGLSANKTSFIEGESISLGWLVANATKLTLNGVDVTGKNTLVVTPPTNAATTYTLVATNGIETVSASKTITPVPILDGSSLTINSVKNCVQAADDFMSKMAGVNRRIEPIDCSNVTIGKPVFAWVKPVFDMNPDLPMTFILSKKVGTTETALYMKDTTRTRLLYPAVLEAGEYVWRVKYTTKAGVKITSEARTFYIPQNNQLNLVSGYNLTQSMLSKPHPHVLPRGKTFADIAAANATSEYATSYASFVRWAGTLYTDNKIAPIPANIKPSDFPTSQAYADALVKIKNAATDEGLAIEALAYVGKLNNEKKYLDKAIERAHLLAKWPYADDSATSELQQDQANREIYLTLALSLDLLYNEMNATQRTDIIASLKARLNQAITKFPGFDREPYLSHLITSSQYVVQALLHAVGTPGFPESEAMLITAWENLLTNSGVWGGSRDGGFSNGTAYGWYATASVAYTLASIKLMAEVDLSKWDVYGNMGLNQIHFSAPDLLLRGQFGDEVEVEDNYKNNAKTAFRLLALATGKKEYEWYWRKTPSNVTYSGFLKPIHYMLTGALNELPIDPGEVTIPTSKLFEDAGVVAIHGQGNNSLRSSLFFRSSPFGSYNHSHADQNAFNFVSQGKALLITGGYYPSYMTAHHAQVGRATRFKNALTFNGGIGQAEVGSSPTAPGAPVDQMDSSGKIINFIDNPNWALATGDAAMAYRAYNKDTGVWTPLLQDAIRTVAYNRIEKVAVIYDYATSATARSWELNFQSLNAVTMQNSDKTVRIDNAPASGCIEVYSDSAGKFLRTSGFPIKPEKTLPDQYQTQYKVNTNSTQFVSVTVLRESCVTKPVTVKFTGTKAIVNINGKFITLDKKSVQAN